MSRIFGSFVAAIVLFVLVFVPGLDVEAAPLPPLIVVNHETRECATVLAGDECMDCVPPAGWETLGIAGAVECPQGYTLVEDLAMVCTGFKNSRCCTEGHSGAHGDCEDMVINRSGHQCAFVESVEGCELPKRWSKKPEGADTFDWQCPSGYKWVDNLVCLDEEAEGEQGTARVGGLCPSLVLIAPGALALCWMRRHRA